MTRARDTAGIIGSNTLTIDGSSRIGIGSTVPSSKFEISGNTRATGIVTSFGFSGNITGTAATFTTVNVSGVLTFEDVTNVDSLGIITARNGIQVSGGGGLNFTGGAGIITATTAIVGSAVTVNATGVNATGIVTAAGGVQGIGIYSGGNLVRTGVITALNFVGTGNTFLVTGNRVDISISGGGSSGISSIFLRQAGTTVTGGGATTLNFANATITSISSGIATITTGIVTEALTGSNAVVTLDLADQDHKVTATGICTITCSGGTEGDSHTVRIVNSGIATVGFSTFFLFPSGSVPVLPTASGAISLISFTVHRVGTAGTQLLTGASPNFS